jgi:hypothetical protein
MVQELDGDISEQFRLELVDVCRQISGALDQPALKRLSHHFEKVDRRFGSDVATLIWLTQGRLKDAAETVENPETLKLIRTTLARFDSYFDGDDL